VFLSPGIKEDQKKVKAPKVRECIPVLHEDALSNHFIILMNLSDKTLSAELHVVMKTATHPESPLFLCGMLLQTGCLRCLVA
jgi:hypothetical protein